MGPLAPCTCISTSLSCDLTALGNPEGVSLSFTSSEQGGRDKSNTGQPVALFHIAVGLMTTKHQQVCFLQSCHHKLFAIGFLSIFSFSAYSRSQHILVLSIFSFSAYFRSQHILILTISSFSRLLILLSPHHLLILLSPHPPISSCSDSQLISGSTDVSAITTAHLFLPSAPSS